MDARDREIQFYNAVGEGFARVQEEGRRERASVPAGSSSTLSEAIGQQLAADKKAAEEALHA